MPLRDLIPHSRRHQASRSITHDPAHSRNRVRIGHRERQPARNPQGHPLDNGLVLGNHVMPSGPARWPTTLPSAQGMPHGTVNNPQAFVSIAPDGTVTIVCHRSDMGQGVRTGMPLIVADEMEADWAKVKVAQAPGDEVKYGNQDTDGSRSTRHFFMPMRQVGAAARMMLEAAAENAGASTSPTSRRRTTRSFRSRRERSSAMESSLPTPARWAPSNVSLEKDGRHDACQSASQGSLTVPLHRQGRDQHRRRLQHHDRPRDLWPGHPLAGAEIRRHSAPGGHGRQGRFLRCDGREEDPGRCPDRRDAYAVVPHEISTVRGNRGYRRQHLGCDPGPQGAEDQMG